MSATTLDTAKTAGLLPVPFVQEINRKANEASVVTRLSGQTPIPIEGAAFGVQTGQVQAGVVGEGQLKPITQAAYTSKSVKPVKVAAIVYYSKELRKRNPAGMLDTIGDDLAGAVTRAFDLAILRGTNAVTGHIAGVEYIDQTTKRVTLDTATANAGGLTSDLLDGYDLVVNDEDGDYGFSGWAADPRFRTKLMKAVDVQGKPVFQAGVDLSKGIDDLLGLPVAYGKAVAGKVGAVAASDVRIYGGDFAGGLKYGFAEEISYSLSDQATIQDGNTTVHLWQQNMEAMLVEAIFGWVITDVDGFVAYELAAEGEGA